MSTPSRRTRPLPPDWQQTRQRILNRDRHTCRRCDKPGTHVDHITPASQHGTDRDDNLQTLCARCHNRKTGREAAAARAKQQARTVRPVEQHPGIIRN